MSLAGIIDTWKYSVTAAVPWVHRFCSWIEDVAKEANGLPSQLFFFLLRGGSTDNKYRVATEPKPFYIVVGVVGRRPPVILDNDYVCCDTIRRRVYLGSSTY